MPLSRSELLRRAWPDAIDNPRTVDTHVLSLRKKIEIDPRQPSLIQTVRNVGYRFNLELLTPPSNRPKDYPDHRKSLARSTAQMVVGERGRS
ncbi:winged helix-turn-helix domain-containing protein [Kovacikia minuta]|uniref:winged helix-turn-helix domain-containing protein n=1 Tax=Kovacikia minuta TaxID=2931930 RepID=UPI0036F22AD9